MRRFMSQRRGRHVLLRLQSDEETGTENDARMAKLDKLGRAMGEAIEARIERLGHARIAHGVEIDEDGDAIAWIRTEEEEPTNHDGEPSGVRKKNIEDETVADIEQRLTGRGFARVPPDRPDVSKPKGGHNA